VSQEKQSHWMNRLANRLFPRSIDFYALLNEQCAVVDSGSLSLLRFMQSQESKNATTLYRLEHEADRIKARNLDVLHRSFATPMDREDIYRAMTALDTVISYTRATVREMSVLQVHPDSHMLAMAQLLNEGTQSIKSGFAHLQHNPKKAELDADRARKTERKTEKVYRMALAELFDVEHSMSLVSNNNQNVTGSDDVSKSVIIVMEILKRREVYRHMSNAADRVVIVGEVLHDIVVKAT